MVCKHRFDALPHPFIGRYLAVPSPALIPSPRLPRLKPTQRPEGPMAKLNPSSESCEMLLHGRCINITRQTQPRVYICAFCADTPNAHVGRGRDMKRAATTAAGAGAGTSGPGTNMNGNPRGAVPPPLTHKSFRSFR